MNNKNNNCPPLKVGYLLYFKPADTIGIIADIYENDKNDLIMKVYWSQPIGGADYYEHTVRLVNWQMAMQVYET
jgi:hypothetical protein